MNIWESIPERRVGEESQYSYWDSESAIALLLLYLIPNQMKFAKTLYSGKDSGWI